jgi:hypothetical protein
MEHYNHHTKNIHLLQTQSAIHDDMICNELKNCNQFHKMNQNDYGVLLFYDGEMNLKIKKTDEQ